MRRALDCTRKQKLEQATRIIQDALSGTRTSAVANKAAPERRSIRPLGQVIDLLREGRLTAGLFQPVPNNTKPRVQTKHGPAIADGAQFVTRMVACKAGKRKYKLYIPAAKKPRGLVVMLHGCKQNPDDFATGTNMNAIAEAHDLLVAYPAQPTTANRASCWNWFNPKDQARDAGEPSIIAEMTRTLMSAYGLDRRQVFVAGLSAGGAMAVVLGATYPDLYDAAGIHSGLAYKSANDVVSAFAAMRGEGGVIPSRRSPLANRVYDPVRTIVFQGLSDRTVHPVNAERIVAAASANLRTDHKYHESRRSAGGRSFGHTVVTDADGVPLLEHWKLDGAGHNWSGGQPGGSYMDQRGPDASSEMVRFFLRKPITPRKI